MEFPDKYLATVHSALMRAFSRFGWDARLVYPFLIGQKVRNYPAVTTQQAAQLRVFCKRSLRVARVPMSITTDSDDYLFMCLADKFARTVRVGYGPCSAGADW